MEKKICQNPNCNNKLKGRQTRYCSNKCSAIFANKLHNKGVKLKIKKIFCNNCGCWFKHYNFDKHLLVCIVKCANQGCNNIVKKRQTKYCSEICRRENFKNLSIIHSSPKFGKIKCDICNLEFSSNNFKRHRDVCLPYEKKLCLVCDNELESGHFKWCSEKCWRKYFNLPSECKNKNCSKKLSDGQKYFCSNLCLRTNSLKNTISKVEIYFGEKIEEIFGVKLHSQFNLFGRCFDYKVPGKNILIECDGSYWHSRPDVIKHDKIRNGIADRFGFILQRFTLDRKSDVDELLKKNFEKIKELIL